MVLHSEKLSSSQLICGLGISEHGVCENDELSGDGVEDEAFWLSSGCETLGEGLEIWIVSGGDHGGHEEDGLEALTPRT